MSELDKAIEDIRLAINSQETKIEGDLKRFISQLILSGDIHSIRQFPTPSIKLHTEYEKDYKINVEQAFLHIYEPFKLKNELEKKIQRLEAKNKILMEAVEFVAMPITSNDLTLKSLMETMKNDSKKCKKAIKKCEQIEND